MCSRCRELEAERDEALRLVLAQHNELIGLRDEVRRELGRLRSLRYERHQLVAGANAVRDPERDPLQ